VAEVYKARDTALNRMVAIKHFGLETLVYPNQMDNLKERFIREAQVAAQLHHPNIVTTYDIISTPEVNVLVMELVQGVTLQSVIASKKLSLSETIQILSQVAAALDYAHEQKVVHRDVKPANVLVASSGQVKVADFGIAKAESSTDLTAAGGVLGTPDYMSPEQAKGVEVDGRSDLFSLGCVLYECLAGEKPFQASTLTAVLLKIVNEDPPPIDREKWRLPGGIQEIMDRALAKDPKKRFASGTELVEAIRSLPEQELPETPESRENEREALDAIRGVEDSVADTLMKEARRTTKIEPHLKALYRDDRKLRLVSSPMLSFQNVKLTPEEGFILSRIDGTLTPADIFSISSLSEEETARTLLGLLRSGIVELESGATGRDAARKAEAPKSQPSAGSPKLGAKERQEIELMFVRFQEQDDWQVLDIAPGADLQTIKRAFQKKTLRYHPDRYHHVDDPALHKKVSFIFTRVSEAFANLSNRAEESRSAESTRRPIPPAASPAAETPGDDDPGKRAKQLFQRAKRAYDKTDYWEAIQFCREAIELANDQAEYFHLLGLALARNPSWRKEAEENLRIASSLDPLNAEYFLILGEIYQREGLDLRARKMFEQAKKIDPDCKIPGKD
jgi:serine/threonine protein kinase/curved DNA-binding protein CbpA